MALARLAALLGGSAVLPSHALRTSKSWESPGASRDLERYSFNDFVTEFQRTYEEGSEQWQMRKNLFHERLTEVTSFNSNPDRTWQKGITEFMDYTDHERRRLLGYRGRGSRHSSYDFPAEVVSLRRGGPHAPREFSVERQGSQLVHLVRDQGNCGSCWAVAATSALEGQMEANKTLMAALQQMHVKSAAPEVPTLSSQAVVSCTPNKRHCGGSGGCTGATVELAYEMVKGNGGLPFASDWAYESGTSGVAPSCKSELFPGAKIGISGHITLPVNKASPLKMALVQTGGPVAVSVDASHWFIYVGGVYSDMVYGQGDFQVNHAVVLMGYKEPDEDNIGYWALKNSWGKTWGENGKIRVEMKMDEDSHCGWDTNTHEGIACDGDADRAWVCGTCGILYDSAYPTGVHLKMA